MSRSGGRPGVSCALVLLFLSNSILADDESNEIELRSAFGYIVIDTDIQRTVTNWRLSNKIIIDKLPLGRTLQLIAVRAGSYQWQEINIPYYNLPHSLDLFDDRRWAFQVQKQSINYFGSLLVGEERGSDHVDARIINRSAEVIALLREKFPEHMALYDVKYSGNTRDDFLQLIQAPHSDAQGD